MAGATLLAIVGPTASGKSEAALGVAVALGAEIVSVDSMLVYRGMDLGTAKPSRDERLRVPHHAIDLADPSEPFSVARYQELVRIAIERIRARGRKVLLVGGSGLYFRAAVDELAFPTTDPGTRAALEAEAVAVGPIRMHSRLTALDPAAAAKIEPGNVRRTIRALEVAAVTGSPFSSFAEGWDAYASERVCAAGVELPPDVLAKRIRARVRTMLEAGWLDEVRGLLDRGLFGWLTSSRAIGYAEMARHLGGELTLEEAVAQVVKRTRALARRQLAWFRRDPRIRWFPAGEGGAAAITDRLTEYLRDR